MKYQIEQILKNQEEIKKELADIKIQLLNLQPTLTINQGSSWGQYAYLGNFTPINGTADDSVCTNCHNSYSSSNRHICPPESMNDVATFENYNAQLPADYFSITTHTRCSCGHLNGASDLKCSNCGNRLGTTT